MEKMPLSCSLHRQTKAALAREYLKQFGILLKTPEQIEGIRHACQLAASILEETCKHGKSGRNTDELNTFADSLHRKAGAIPAPLGYGDPPFPKSICTSLNEVICHGIPDDTPSSRGRYRQYRHHLHFKRILWRLQRDGRDRED